MGALHAGHLALVERARSECAATVASVFVNPLQFGPAEDFARYPRRFEADSRALAHAGVDVLYAPPPERMYGEGFSTSVDVGGLGGVFEGAVRPGHFAGVTTVVAKLLHAVEPTVLYLGQKDVQQTAVIRRMVADLDIATCVAVVPTIREPDGLALSSRNAYLSPEERAAAPSLYRALRAVQTAVDAGEIDPERALALGRSALEQPLVWEYLAIVDPLTFEPQTERIARPALIVAAVHAGATRLIDNVTLVAPGEPDPVVTPLREKPAATVR
jgi:pantoate--beta-alanine ligase